MLSADELERRIMSLNGQHRRWKVGRLNKHEFVAEWQVDDRTWQGLFGRDGLTRARALRLRLARGRKAVKVAEERYEVKSEGKWTPDGRVVSRRRPVIGLDLASWYRRVHSGDGENLTFEIVSEAERGYDVTLIKREIAETVLKAGWSYQPALFLRWS